jgi:hypothetical protein
MRVLLRALFCLALGAAAWSSAPAAWAHEVGLSRGNYRVSGAVLVAELVFARKEVTGLVPALDADSSGGLSPEEVSAGRAAIARRVLPAITVRGDGAPCLGALDEARLVEEDGLTLLLSFTCPAAPRRLEVALPVIAELATGHRHIAAATSDGKPVGHVLSRSSSSFALVVASATPASGGVAGGGAAGGGFGDLVRLGIERVALGYAHVAFLFGLVLVGGSWRALLAAIGGFTAGHSLTLALAALGVFAPSARVVGPAIALTIAYVGLENWFLRDPEKRWRVALPFGLVHGFGLAGTLSGLAGTRGAAAKVAAFHLGVELGQLAVLAVVLPVVLLARQQEWFRRIGVKALSAAVVAAGVFWFVLGVTDR